MIKHQDSFKYIETIDNQYNKLKPRQRHRIINNKGNRTQKYKPRYNTTKIPQK